MERKSRISLGALEEVEKALREYAKEVLSAGYGEMAVNQHIDKADLFVRWLKFEFTPGAGLERFGKPRSPKQS